MNQEESAQFTPPRRTHRVQIAMPVIVRGTILDKPFQEETRTVAVNAHGCLVLLSTPVEKAQAISMVNPTTAEEVPGSVVSLGKPEDGKISVGVQFSEASPLFWGINFPPDDWFNSSERKRLEPGVRKR